MTLRKLTKPSGNAKAGAMQNGHAIGTRWARAGMAGLIAAGLAGCINVAAPDKPIVIELNINIRQEVIYRLAEDAAATIEENADIF